MFVVDVSSYSPNKDKNNYSFINREEDKKKWAGDEGIKTGWIHN